MKLAQVTNAIFWQEGSSLEFHQFYIDYSTQKEFWYFFCSDFHLEAPGTDLKLLKRELDNAQTQNARIFINGDVFNFLLPSDRKRYSKSEDKTQRDDLLNVALQTATTFLQPYVDYIDIIGIGNHEKEVIRRHSVDLTAFLIETLNQSRSRSLPRIRHGGYTGFIRLSYTVGGGGGKTYDIFYNHGQGGSSEITKGLIDLNRYAGHTDANLIWLGHKHTKWLGELDRITTVTAGNTLTTKPRKGMLTGCYTKPLKEYDIVKEGYQINFGEEKMRVPTAQGGILMKHTLSSHHLETSFVF